MHMMWTVPHLIGCDRNVNCSLLRTGGGGTHASWCVTHPTPTVARAEWPASAHVLAPSAHRLACRENELARVESALVPLPTQLPGRACDVVHDAPAWVRHVLGPARNAHPWFRWACAQVRGGIGLVRHGLEHAHCGHALFGRAPERVRHATGRIRHSPDRSLLANASIDAPFKRIAQILVRLGAHALVPTFLGPCR